MQRVIVLMLFKLTVTKCKNRNEKHTILEQREKKMQQFNLG